MRQGAGKDFIAGVSKSLGDESNGAGSAGLARPPTQGGKRIKRIIYGALTALTVAAAGLNGAAATDNTIGPKVVDTITSASLKLIQSALPELTRYGLKLDGYRITVMAWNGKHVVIFKDLNASPSCRGSCSRDKPGFEVELSEDGAVVRSHFMQ